MPSLGEIAPKPPAKEQEKKLEIPPEYLEEIARQERLHIRQTIVDAGREELPNELQQFTDLLNAANTLASTSKTTEAEALDNTKLLLQVVGYILKTPELRDRLIDVVKAITKKPPSSETK